MQPTAISPTSLSPNTEPDKRFALRSIAAGRIVELDPPGFGNRIAARDIYFGELRLAQIPSRFQLEISSFKWNGFLGQGHFGELVLRDLEHKRQEKPLRNEPRGCTSNDFWNCKKCLEPQTQFKRQVDFFSSNNVFKVIKGNPPLHLSHSGPTRAVHSAVRAWAARSGSVRSM